MFNKVRDLVYSDKRIQMKAIPQALGISHGSVSTILHDRLGMRKLTARWGPKSFSEEQMATRASVCSGLSKRFRSKYDFLLRLVTEDETCFILMSQRINPRVVSGSPRPKKFKTQPSAGKVMATVVWDAKGVIMLDFLPKRSTIAGVYYANLLDQQRTAILEKRRGKLTKGVLLKLDNPRSTLAKLQWML